MSRSKGNSPKETQAVAGIVVAAWVLLPVGIVLLFFGMDDDEQWRGIPGLACLGAAIVCAVAGLVRIQRSGERLRGTVGAILVILFSGSIMLQGPPAQTRAREDARRTQCRSNLRQIGLALSIYAKDYGGWGPTIAPKAREIANAAGVPSGCVLTFRGEDGRWTPNGLGLLVEGGYFCTYGLRGMYCPSRSGNDHELVAAFDTDGRDPFWTSPGTAGINGDGISELPSGDALVSSFLLRYNADNAHGAMRFDFDAAFARDPSMSRWVREPAEREPPALKVIVSDLLFFGKRGAVRNHQGVYNVLFTDGSVRTFRDEERQIGEICKGVQAEEIERVLDEGIFGVFFDSLHSEE